ncbi:unnamed protein product [Caenorhabditis auriculariae]|uniref:Uncharacterized protein n=1 Tax=Caenorhabditis auriculariae TaxID=2777116 RepID=A0A8S1HQS4_9PELO|nr:unnamed protein product [Caenorhabditis auriculariae]
MATVPETNEGGVTTPSTTVNISTVSKKDDEKRDQWGNQFEFLLTVLGLSVGLGNIWRFPMRAYDNGGSAFLIPYMSCAVLFGLPAMYLEATLGQFHRATPPTLFRRIAPILQGVGWMNVMVASSVSVYYIVLIGWITIYMMGVFLGHTDKWVRCDNSWNDPNTCFSLREQELCSANMSFPVYFNGTCTTPQYVKTIATIGATEQYFTDYVLLPSQGFTDFNLMNWKSLAGMTACWIFTILVLLKGVQYLGKTSYVTVILPYVIVLILFFRGITLEGAEDGLYYYLGKPDFSKVFIMKTWTEALKQMCFSLSVGYGGMITLASFNKPRNNCFRDALVVVIGDTFMSLIGGAAVFSTLGFLARQRDIEVPEVVQSGLSLAFVVYPEAMSRMPLPWLWAFLFFIMLFFLGISSEIALVEIGVASFIDQMPTWKPRRWAVVIGWCFILFSFGLVMCTDGGFYWFVMFDEYAAGVSSCVSLTVEILVIAYVYGRRNQELDMLEMLGPPKNAITKLIGQHSPYYQFNWMLVTPTLGTALVILSSIRDYPFEGDPNKYPVLFDIVGWFVCSIPVLMLPIFALVAVWQFGKDGYLLRGIFMKQRQLPSYPRIYAEMTLEEKNLQRILPDREPWSSAVNGYQFPDVLPADDSDPPLIPNASKMTRFVAADVNSKASPVEVKSSPGSDPGTPKGNSKIYNKFIVMITSLAAEIGALRLVSACSSQMIVARRHLPARGTKPLPRYLWDMEDLEKKSGGQYTPEPLRINRLGGRNPETGRKVNQHIGGGTKFDYFMIDFHRRGPTEAGETYDERVLEVRRDPNRTSHIALLAGQKGKRWILATENMKAGDIVSTTCHLSENPVIGVEGNAYPLGSLAIGTIVNSVERYPTTESEVFVQSAGAAATIVRHQGDFTVVKLPHKHEFSMHRECMATVGRLSHADISSKIFGSAQMHRRFGYKMSSGLFHKKDGYFGRKVRALPPVRVLDAPPTEPPPKQRFTLTKDDLSGLHGHAKVHNLLPSGYNTRDYPQ